MRALSISPVSDADVEWMGSNTERFQGSTFGVDQQEFWRTVKRRKVATLDTDHFTLALSPLPGGRLHVFLDPSHPGPVCFTLRFEGVDRSG